MNALPLVPARREGVSLSSCPLLSIVTFFLPNFQGLFSLSVSAILVIVNLITSSCVDLFGCKGPYFP